MVNILNPADDVYKIPEPPSLEQRIAEFRVLRPYVVEAFEEDVCPYADNIRDGARTALWLLESQEFFAFLEFLRFAKALNISSATLAIELERAGELERK